MNLFASIEKWLALVIIGVHAANSVPGATSADKKAVVLDKVKTVGDAIAAASGDPKIQMVSMAIDVAAQVINALTAKTPTPPPA